MAVDSQDFQDPDSGRRIAEAGPAPYDLVLSTPKATCLSRPRAQSISWSQPDASATKLRDQATDVVGGDSDWRCLRVLTPTVIRRRGDHPCSSVVAFHLTGHVTTLAGRGGRAAPPNGRQINSQDTQTAGSVVTNESGHLEAIDNLTVVTVPDSAGRRLRAEFGDPFGIDQRHVIRAVIAVMGQAGQVTPAFQAAMSSVSMDLRPQGRSDAPAHDPTRVNVGDERDVGEGALLRGRRNTGVCTRSAGFTASGSGFLANTFLDLLTPCTPVILINLAVWSRPTSHASGHGSSGPRRRHSPPRAAGRSRAPATRP